MFQFTALAGAQSTSRASQSILELDGGVKILVDVGWDERFDTRQLAELEKHVSTLSFVLLTHATISHLGAYAHCCKHIPLFSQVPVYATAPIIAFGRTTLQDLYSSAPAAATFIPLSASNEDPSAVDDPTRSNILREAPTFDEINTYFSAITPLKYSQPHQPTPSYFSAPLEGLTLTAYNAGHTLGGTIWHIQHGMESIVYAVDWHQARENVVAGAAWFDGIGGAEVTEALRKPTALVCSSVNGDKVALSGGRKARDESLLKHIKSGLSKRGSILIPTDSSARILELAYLLERAWQDHKDDEHLKHAKLYMVTKSGHATLRHARSLLEWMDDSIVREFEGDEDATVAKTHKRSRSKQTNTAAQPSRPFEFKHVRVIETQKRLDKILSADGPRVIIASDRSMEWGHSRTVLEHLAQKPENLVILTEAHYTEGTKNTAAGATLWQWHSERLNGVNLEKSADGDQIEQINTGKELVFHNATRMPLDEKELVKFQQYMATQKQLQDALVTADGRQLADAEEAMDEDDESSSESEDDEDQQQGRVLNVSAALTHGNRNKVALSDEDLGVSILLRKKGVYDFDVRNKRGRNAVFPYTHSKRRGDEFGDFIKPEDFLREEEKEAQDAMVDEKLNSVLGQKRKWTEDKPKQSKHSKRSRQDEMADADDLDGDQSSSDESDSEFESGGADIQKHAPSKIVYHESRIKFEAKLAYVDFAGLHDQRSLQMLIPLVNPKKLILVGGSTSETAALANDCKDLLGMKVIGEDSEAKAEIYSPQVGDVIDASVDTNAWTVKLTRDLVKRLQWQNVKNMSIVTITGQLRVERQQIGEETAAKKAKLEGQAQQSIEETTKAENIAGNVNPVLDAIPASVAASIRAVTHPVHVGELRLADLRRLMRDSGHSAVFRGEGTLLIDDTVAVRKLASGKIVVEGPPVNSTFSSDSFTRVKRMIYDGLAVVAAG